MIDLTTVTVDNCNRVFVDCMREYIGPGRQHSYEAAAEKLGIERRTVESYVLGASMPTLPKLMRLFALLGPVFVNRILSMAGYGDARRYENADEVTEFQLNAKTAGLIKKISEAIKDGRVDEREHEQLINAARHLNAVLADYIYRGSNRVFISKKAKGARR